MEEAEAPETVVNVFHYQFTWHFENVYMCKKLLESSVNGPLFGWKNLSFPWMLKLGPANHPHLKGIALHVTRSNIPKNGIATANFRVIVHKGMDSEPLLDMKFRGDFCHGSTWSTPIIVTNDEFRREPALKGTQNFWKIQVHLMWNESISFQYVSEQCPYTSAYWRDFMYGRSVGLDLKKFYREEWLSDIYIKIGDDQIPAHKAILARCPYLAEKLVSYPVMSQVTRGDFIPSNDPDVVDTFLKFLYSGDIYSITDDGPLPLGIDTLAQVTGMYHLLYITSPVKFSAKTVVELETVTHEWVIKGSQIKKKMDESINVVKESSSAANVKEFKELFAVTIQELSLVHIAKRPSSDDGAKVLQSDDGAKVLQSDDGAKVLQSDDGAKVLQSDDGAKVLQSDDGAKVLQSDDGAKVLQSNDVVKDDLKGTSSFATAGESSSSGIFKEPVNVDITRERFENADAFILRVTIRRSHPSISVSLQFKNKENEDGVYAAVQLTVNCIAVGEIYSKRVAKYLSSSDIAEFPDVLDVDDLSQEDVDLELKFKCEIQYSKDHLETVIEDIPRFFLTESIKTYPDFNFMKACVGWNSLRIHMTRLMLTEMCSDCSILIQNSSLPCHRVVLAARSPYFPGVFRRKEQENGPWSSYGMEIRDLNDIGINSYFMKVVLKAIYTGCFEIEEGQSIGDVEGISQLLGIG